MIKLNTKEIALILCAKPIQAWGAIGEKVIICNASKLCREWPMSELLLNLVIISIPKKIGLNKCVNYQARSLCNHIHAKNTVTVPLERPPDTTRAVSSKNTSWL